MVYNDLNSDYLPKIKEALNHTETTFGLFLGHNNIPEEQLVELKDKHPEQIFY